MILYSSGPPVVRRGEFVPLPGVRGRARAVPYAGLDLPGADPWKGEYRRKTDDLDVVAGPASPERWEESLAAAPRGSVLLGPVAECETVYGAASAAIEAARNAGRGSVVVDAVCDPRDLPGGDDVVWVALWRPDAEAQFWKRAEDSRAKGRSGVALPLIPGWTTNPAFLRDFFGRARSALLEFAVPFEVSLDGYSRSAIHADFSSRFPEDADSYFDRLHHRDGSHEVASARVSFEELAAAAGISTRAPLPRGRADFESSLRAREALEAEADRVGEPRASLLRSASRRIEDFGRDLAELARQGNGRLLFPAESAEWRVIEEALGTFPSERKR